jgi:RNA polymerase sigma-70 factor (ECF subfamily)
MRSADARADAADVGSAARRLPPEEWAVIELVYFENLCLSETAEQLGLPLGTVRLRTSRGVRRLASLMRGPAR